MTRRVATIGYGTIGTTVVSGLGRSRLGPFAQAVLVRPGSPSAAKLPDGVEPLLSREALVAWRPDLVVEAAGQDAVRAFAAPCLEAGISFLACSAGALADDGLFGALVQSAERTGAKLIIPSGAVASLDYVAAVRTMPDAELVYESRKPPSAWRDELARRGHDPDALAEPVMLFAGSAREAATLFPQNLNVAATLALAGGGLDSTRVRVVVDPEARGNTHRVTMSSSAGELRTEVVNKPSPDNPKTSWVTGLSALAVAERFFSPVVIG